MTSSYDKAPTVTHAISFTLISVIICITIFLCWMRHITARDLKRQRTLERKRLRHHTTSSFRTNRAPDSISYVPPSNSQVSAHVGINHHVYAQPTGRQHLSLKEPYSSTRRGLPTVTTYVSHDDPEICNSISVNATTSQNSSFKRYPSTSTRITTRSTSRKKRSFSGSYQPRPILEGKEPDDEDDSAFDAGVVVTTKTQVNLQPKSSFSVSQTTNSNSQARNFRHSYR